MAPFSRVELLRGTLDLLILRTLLPAPNHGHAIARHIQRTSEDRFHAPDPSALIGAVATLVCAAMLAGYLPARHASRIDPMIALRHD